jgi:chemotaxis protein MotA
MGLANIIGVALGVLMLFLSCTGGGGKPNQMVLFIDPPSFFLVIGGSISALFIGYPMKPLLQLHKYVLITFTAKDRDPLKTIEQLATLAEAARREGLLSLENHMDEIDDTFLAMGIRMAVDGMSPEVVESIMNIELESVDRRHAYNKSILSNFGRYAPAWGMLGTVVGLVIMLADLDPEKLGPGMAVAMITTFYGSIAANLMFLPWADKLGFINEDEMLIKEITLKGVIAIQSGENPRVVKQKLLMYLPPAMRPEETEEG